MITLLLVFGMIDFSRAVYARSVLQWAAQQGARTGLTEWEAQPWSRDRPATATELDALELVVAEAVESRLADLGLNEADAEVEVNQLTISVIQVDVAYEFYFLVPLISRITGETLALEAAASMVIH
jgi:hypothetical protein